jgi:methylated-DNA-[protein]-cysteine S-methyltransferase
MLQFDTLPSPLGPLLIAVTRRGIVRVAFEDEGVEETVEELQELVGEQADRAELDDERRQFAEYFGGTRTHFDLHADLQLVSTPFARRVLEATARIPYGATATYGDVAEMAGRPRAARAAGNALRLNPVPLIVPCHRVVPADGGIGGYAGREDRKAWLLDLESRAGAREVPVRTGRTGPSAGRDVPVN